MKKKSPTYLFNGTQGAKQSSVDPMERGLFVPCSDSRICLRLLTVSSFESIGSQDVLKTFYPKLYGSCLHSLKFRLETSVPGQSAIGK